MFKDVEEVEKKTLGPNYENYLTMKHNLASCYQKANDFETVFQLFKEMEEVNHNSWFKIMKVILQQKQSSALYIEKFNAADSRYLQESVPPL